MRMERRLFISGFASTLAACASGAKSQSDGVLIFGASRATGLETAKVLTARGEKATGIHDRHEHGDVEPEF